MEDIPDMETSHPVGITISAVVLFLAAIHPTDAFLFLGPAVITYIVIVTVFSRAKQGHR